MSALDVREVMTFLQQTLPFQNLAQRELNQLINSMEVRYIRHDQQIEIGLTAKGEQFALGLYIIRRGAFEIRTAHNYLVDRIADGECFGVSSLLEDNPEGFVVSAIEDSLVYSISKKAFLELADKNEAFAHYFSQIRDNRLHKLSGSEANVLSKPALQIAVPLLQLMSKNPITTTSHASIQSAAIKMTDARVSSILIVENKKLIGIVTDRDLRSRVLTRSFSIEKTIENTPILDIMTHNPLCLEESSSSLTAQLLMSKHNIHHLPIVDLHYCPIGVLSSTDLLRSQSLSPLFIVSELNRQQDVVSLAKVSKRIPELIMNLTLSETNPSEIGEILAAIIDNLTRCLIKLALSMLGEAPMAFNFLVFGSQARKDQSLGSDQDNALMLQRQPTTEESLYFEQLANFICDGLDACGIPYCPGHIMATNKDYVMTQKQWLEKFNYWIESNSPQSLLQASIFFDIRSVYGDKAAVVKLTRLLQEKAVRNTIFLATLTNNAVSSKPPLGFFRNFVLEHTGEHQNQLDLKHQGLALINDLARIYMFSCNTYQPTTLGRLQYIAEQGLLGHDYVNNLKDAWLYLSSLRYETQQRHWQIKGKASAFLDPSILSPLQRQHLKLTFKSIAQVQGVTHNKYAQGLG